MARTGVVHRENGWKAGDTCTAVRQSSSEGEAPADANNAGDATEIVRGSVCRQEAGLKKAMVEVVPAQFRDGDGGKKSLEKEMSKMVGLTSLSAVVVGKNDLTTRAVQLRV